LAVLLFTANVLAQAPALDDGDPLELERAVAIALTTNPGLAGVEARAEALAAMPPQAGALPDPMLALNAMNLPTDTFDLDQEPMTQVQIAVSQAVPFPGKRGLQRAAAEHEAAAGSAAVGERRLGLTGEVRAVWWRLFFLDRALQIIAQNQELMRDFVDIAQTKYKVGSGLQQDVLLAQLELSWLLNRELHLRGQREASQAELNALLDRPGNRSIRLPVAPPNEALPKLPPDAALLERAAGTRPLLVAQRELVEAARDRIDLAKRDYYPDFRLGAAYGFRETRDRLTGEELPDFLSLMVSVNVPIYSKSRQSKAVEQRAGELSQRRFLLNDALRGVESSISRHRARYRAAREQVMLFRTAIVPQARQTVQSMLAGYQVNQVDFLNVMNAQLRLYDAQINHWEALSDAKQALARVAAAVGQESLYE
jgi:outer membrane protein TolC